MTPPTLAPGSSMDSDGPSPKHGHPRPSSPLHLIARVLLIATICLAPWAFGAVQTWAWGTLIVMSLVIFALWAMGCAHRGVLEICWSPLTWPFLALLAIALVQLWAGLSTDPVATREAVLKLVANLLFFFLAGQLFNGQPQNRKALNHFGLVVTLLAIALAGFALAQWSLNKDPGMIYWTYRPHGAPFGPYVNHNNYSGLMEMLLPIAAAYLLSRLWHFGMVLVLWGGVGLAIISVWVGGSKAGAVVLVVEGLLWVGILVSQQPRGVAPKYLAALGGVALISAVAFSWLVATGRARGQAWSVFSSSNPLEVSLRDRLRVGWDTLQMTRKHPLTGIGAGCFESVYPNYLGFPSELHWTHAHNDLLEGVAETGLPGLVLLAVSFVLFLRLAFRQVKVRLRHGSGWVQMGAAVAVIGFLVHSLVDFNLRIPANAAWFVVCLAVATHYRVNLAPEPELEVEPEPETEQETAWEPTANQTSAYLT